MASFEHPDTLKLLQNLLKPPDQSSESEDDEISAPSYKKFGPGNIGGGPMKALKESRPEKESSVQKSFVVPESNEKDEIENWLEKQEKEDSEMLENRKIPKYEILFKQAIGTEDVYLQMNNKTPASISCEDIVIKIEIPDETVDVEEMDLSVTDTEIDLKTPIYRLKLPLIHKVDPTKGKAGFDSDKKILTLTLRMKREFDYVNF